MFTLINLVKTLNVPFFPEVLSRDLLTKDWFHPPDTNPYLFQFINKLKKNVTDINFDN